ELIGERIGAFKITEVVGRGGMGVVYKGQDTRLDRVVAVKAMPSYLLEDAAAQARFQREAKLLASLSHPNIAVIHDIIEQTGGRVYLVLEYVPGETLAERMAKSELKLEEVLSIALQIAEAVAAAHEHGVIHRDLKPGNIKITPEGKVKVLDFGLAKAVSREPSERDSAITQAGRVIGTPAYMSPEQARGKSTDRRTDIWSFGCLFYEMLTGHLPFEGETTTDVLARIIEGEPDWDLLPKTTPANVRVLLRRCLAKEPHRRLQHIGDAVLEIDETLTLPAAESGIGEPVVGKARRALWCFGIGCSVAGIIVGLIAASIFLGEPTGPLPTTVVGVPSRRTVIRLPENQVLGIFQSHPLGQRQPALALSPDGSRMVYVAYVDGTTQLFERLMDQFEVRAITGTEGASVPFFKPDGLSVGFFANEKLKTVSLLGGEPVTLCPGYSGGNRGASWGDDGMIYFPERDRPLRVSETGGDKEPLGAGSERISCRYLQVLPGSQGVLFSGRRGIGLFSLRTGQTRMLVKGGAQARYVPTGHIIYVGAWAIEAVPFNLATLKVNGLSVPVLDGPLLSPAQFALSDDGLLVYAPGVSTRKSIPVWVDRQGVVVSTLMPAQFYSTFRLSPDGKRLAIVVDELQSNVYIYDVASGTGTKLTLEGENGYPIWTLDGKRVIFSRHRKADKQWDILWALADGSGEAELLCSGKSVLAPCSLSSDGKLLALTRGHNELCVLPLEGPRELEPLLETEFMENQPNFSPDDRWIAYKSDRNGGHQVYVRPYPAMDRVSQISYDLGDEPAWSPDGKELFYRSRNKWMAVSISTEPQFKADPTQVVFEGPYKDTMARSWDVAPDGQRFLVLKPQYDDSQIRELHVVTNWFEELKRLVPSGREQ
ncbi:MAG: protein kinase domain-containing protein, partial [Planctomycetota bacterium]